MTFRHHSFRLGGLIETVEVKQGKAEIGERKRKRVKRISMQSDTKTADWASLPVKGDDPRTGINCLLAGRDFFLLFVCTSKTSSHQVFS